MASAGSRLGTRLQADAAAALFLAAVVVALHAPALTEGKLISPSALLYVLAPWNGSAPPPSALPLEFNFLASDVAFCFDPWRVEYLASIERREFPLWTPHAYCGVPLAGNAQSAVFFPLNLLAWLAPKLWTFTLAALLKLWLAGLFSYLFLRRRGVGALAATLAGTGMIAGGWMTVWMGHPHTQSAIALPMLLWAVDVWLGSRFRGAVVLVAATSSVAWLGGHPETALHLLAYASVYALFRIVAEFRGARLRMLFWYAGAQLLALGLAAVQILPFAEYLSESAVASGRMTEWIGDGADAKSLILFFVPRFFGQDGDATWWGQFPYANFNELAGYEGAAILILGLLSIRFVRADRELRVFWILGAVCFMLIYGQTLHDHLGWMPIVNVTTQYRLLFELGFSLCLAAAFALDALLRSAGERKGRSTTLLVLWSVVAGSLAVIAVFWATYRYGSPQSIRDPRFTVWCVGAGLAFIVQGGLIHLLALAPPRRGRWFASALLVLASLELWTWSHGYIGFIAPRDVPPPTELTNLLRRDEALYRIFSVGSILPSNTPAYYGISTVEGHDAVGVGRYAGILRPLRDSPFRNEGGPIPEGIRPTLDQLNVKYIVAPAQATVSGDGIRLVHDGADGRVYLNEHAWPRAFWTPREEVAAGRVAPSAVGAVSVRTYAPRTSSFVVEAPADGFLVVTDTFYPGWKALVAGRPREIEPALVAFRAVPVPAGRHDVVFRYDPLSFRWGAGCSLACLALLLGVTLRYFGAHRTGEEKHHDTRTG